MPRCCCFILISILSLFSLAGLTMNKDAKYERESIHNYFQGGSINKITYCVFGDKKYEEGYCVSRYRIFEDKNGPSALFYEDTALLESGCNNGSSLLNGLICHGKVRRALKNFEDAEKKYDDQSSNL